MHALRLGYVVFAASLGLCVLRAQEGEFVNPQLQWYTIRTMHFFVHYHEGAERTAREVARAAEGIYGPITSLYGHEPDQPVSFIIRDHDDYSNGAAYFYDNKIEIYASALDFELRGTHPWIPNVVTHEFTHIVQIQTAMKLGRRVPAVYFQWFGYESERRPDVLYGFPNVLVSYPFSAFVVPSWFAEGTAQFNHPDLTYDFWDSHRDMILRMYLLEGKPLTWEEMSVFGKTSLGNESSYNAGFSIVQYIAEAYGVDKLHALSRSLGSFPRVTMDGAVSDVLGISGEELYARWKDVMTENYRAVAERITASRVEGKIVEAEGFGNASPTFSPDGTKIFYVSNKGKDYFGLSSIYEYDRKSAASRLITDGVRSRLSVSPDGSSLYYAKTSRENPHWAQLLDLYRYDLTEEEETRLTQGLRARDPAVSPDGSFLAFVAGSDGTLNLYLARSDGTQPRRVTNFHEGEQVYAPAWAPDGSSLAIGYSVGHRQSIAIVDTAGKDLRFLVSDSDARNPAFARDGKTLYYASDRSGIFNLYALDLPSGLTSPLTNVLGGAFQPAAASDGAVAYVSYTSSGFKIALLEGNRGVLPGEEVPSPRTLPVSSAISDPTGPLSVPFRGASPVPVQAESDSLLPPHASYRNMFTSLSIIPIIRVDNYNPRNKGIDIVKPGFYFSSTDVLDKLRLFGGAAVNRKLERDLFLSIEYRDRLPLLFEAGLEPSLTLEIYNISRTTTTSFELFPYRISTDVSYNLLEFDLGLRHPLFSEKSDLRLWYSYSTYNAEIGSFINPFTQSISSSFRNTYLIGHALNAHARLRAIVPSTESEINPVGRTFWLRYAYEMNKFNPEGTYDIVNGLLVPVYTRYRFHRLEAEWQEHLALPLAHHTMTVGLRGGGVLGRTVDSFFDFYVGGFTGMKGYPFYALGGNSIAMLQLAYRLPLHRDLGFRLLQFYFTKLYLSVFGDLGNAWTGRMPPLNRWKRDAGLELRLESFSFYAYPTRIFLSGAYGFDRFTRVVQGMTIPYGGEWHFHLGILFGFELNDVTRLR